MTQPEDTSPSCKCFVIERTEHCPVHGLDRSQTTEHPSRQPRESSRVVNTSTSLRNQK